MVVKDEALLRSIGIRASPREVYYAVVEDEGRDVVDLLTASSLLIPPALTLPEQLSFVRTTILDIIDEYGVRRAGIRLAEYTARQTSIERRNLEGVIQELLSSSEVERYFAGAIATLAGLLEVDDRKRVKEFFEGKDFRGISAWEDTGREQRESIVTAVAALNIPPSHA